GGCRAHPCRPGHAVRRISAPLLATDLLLRRAAGSAAPRQDPGGGARGVPRPERRRRAVGAALPTPRDLARIRADRRQGHTLLLPWLAVCAGREDSRNAAGA